MVEKHPKTPPQKTRLKSKQDQRKPAGRPASASPEPGAHDRPGFDLGGSTGKTTAGRGLGLRMDAAESRRGQTLRGRRGKG